MKSIKSLLGIAALTGLVAFGTFAGSAVAAAPHQPQTPGRANTTAPQNPHPIRVTGRVARVGDNVFALQVRNGMTATVYVSEGTWILVPQNGSCVQGSLSELQTGRPAVVAGMTTNDRGVINARTVAQCRAGVADNQPAPRLAKIRQELEKHAGAGTIKSLNGDALIITNAQGKDITVNTSADTIVLNNGFQGAGSLKAGDKVQVFGRPDKSMGSATRTITAWAIRVDNGSTQLMIGHVESVNGSIVTLKTPRHREGVQLTLGGNTGYKSMTVANRQPTFSNATQADVKAGSNMIVEVVASADGKSATANSVVILPSVK